MKKYSIKRYNLEPMTSLRFLVATLLASASTSGLATDAGERKFIRKGMGEGEVASCANPLLNRATGHGGGPCLLHNPIYDFNDELIPLGATYWVR